MINFNEFEKKKKFSFKSIFNKASPPDPTSSSSSALVANSVSRDQSRLAMREESMILNEVDTKTTTDLVNNNNNHNNNNGNKSTRTSISIEGGNGTSNATNSRVCVAGETSSVAGKDRIVNTSAKHKRAFFKLSNDGSTSSASKPARQRRANANEDDDTADAVPDNQNHHHRNSSIGGTAAGVEYKPSKNDNIYRFYITRLKHSLIVSFLFLIPIQNFFLCFISQFFESDKIQMILETITFIVFSIISIILMIYLLHNECKLKEYPIVFSLIIYTLISLNHIIPFVRSKSRHLAIIEYGSFVIYNTIAIYSILPLKKRLTILLSLFISAENFLLLSFFLYYSNLHYYIVIKKLACYGIIFLTANVFGIYHQISTNISQEDSFKNTIKFLNGRIQLEKEKQQQETLMVSVLPAHIALEMKTEMLRKTRKAQMKSLLVNQETIRENSNNGSTLRNLFETATRKIVGRSGTGKPNSIENSPINSRQLNCSTMTVHNQNTNNNPNNTNNNLLNVNQTSGHNANTNNHETTTTTTSSKLNTNASQKNTHRPFFESSRPKASAFHDLHIKSHNNVSILYADIVNFTPLADKFEPPELVNILNKLFAKFDQKAKEFECMRIKILGDCYYCVSGLPIPRPNHADNCVKMGLKMIEIIREVREATGVDVDMRIGVHTGKVLCGVIGLRKWQYDVWSDDVTIANHMESAGIPGSVHISHETYTNLTGDYVVVEGNGAERDSYLREKNIVTYLITPKKLSSFELSRTNLSNSNLNDSTKRSKMSKLELWLNDNSISYENSANSKFAKDESNINDKKNIIFTLLEDSLSPLKFSFKKCFFGLNTISEFNPMTLKFKRSSQTCQRHQYETQAKGASSLKDNLLAYCFGRSTARSPGQGAGTGTHASKWGLSAGLFNRSSRRTNRLNGAKSADVGSSGNNNKIMDDQALIDESNCVVCLAEDNCFYQFGLTKERLFSQQAVPMFKYQMAMCFLIFISIATILLISDLKKTRFFYLLVTFGVIFFSFFIILSLIKCSKYSRNTYSSSLMANVSSLRYFASIISIVCCIMLPWTVLWVSNSNMGVNSVATLAMHQTSSSSLSSSVKVVHTSQSPINKKPVRHLIDKNPMLVGDALKQTTKYVPFDHSNKTTLKPTPTTSRRRIVTTSYPRDDLKFLCTKNSTSSLTYYFFEMHILVFYLSILSCGCFIQMYFHYKLVMMLASLIIYIIASNLNRIFECLAETMDFNLPFLKAELIIQSIFFIMFLHLIDRRIEVNSRLDFLWRLKFKKEMDELEVTSTMSRLLLENMLPKHVVGIILNPKRNRDEVYHEKYDCVAVMFASIPNFKEFYVQSDINKDGLECLRLLNEIIAEFDLLLSKNKYSCVEKIKTIGSTYMAAAGLNIGAEKNKKNIKDRTHHYLMALTDFAFTMMQVLHSINKDCFNEFQLRIGINIGPVVAGVIGASKPQYDIWGNTVNVASRMESTGVMNRIQVPEETKNILEEHGYSCECRGNIYVKGKGEMVTYVVKPKNEI